MKVVRMYEDPEGKKMCEVSEQTAADKAEETPPTVLTRS